MLTRPSSIKPKDSPKQEFTYIDIKAVENGTGKINTDKKIIGANAPSRARRVAKEGEFIISSVRPYLKGFAYLDNVEDNWVFSTGFFILNSKDKKIVLNKFGYNLFMYATDLMDQMKAKMPKGQYPSINQTDVKNFDIPVPNIEVQEDLIDKIEKLKKKVSEARAYIDAAPQKKQEVIQKHL